MLLPEVSISSEKAKMNIFGSNNVIWVLILSPLQKSVFLHTANLYCEYVVRLDTHTTTNVLLHIIR